MSVQVIKESQRLFPAAAIGPIRMAAENAELGGYFIPKGTRVQVRQAAFSPILTILYACPICLIKTLPLVHVMLQICLVHSRHFHGMPAGGCNSEHLR